MNTPGGWGVFAGWLLKSSAQAALLAVLVLAVQWLLRRWLTPRWRYFLWWLVVARLLIPVSLPGPVSIFNWVKWNSPPATAMVVMPVTPEVVLPASPPEMVATAFEETTPALPAQSPIIIAAPAPTNPTRPPFDWRLGLMWLWLAGAALLGARLVWSVLRLRRELRTATPVNDAAVLALLDECRAQMQVRDRLMLLETPLVNSPALCGFWRPRLLLPPGLCRDFTAPQLRFIFLHELAHVRRHDIAVNWLITLLQLLHWFNPLVWLAFSRLRADRELACDALALSVAAPGEQHAYGQTIIRLLEGFARPSAMPGLVGILEDKNQMKRRIRMIAQFRRPGRWAWLSGIAAAILGIACLTDAQPEPADPSTNVVDVQPSPSTQRGKIRMSGIQQLEKEWEQLTAEYNRKLAEIEALEKELSHSSATNEIWSIRQLYRQREEAGLELNQMSALTNFLTSRTPAVLKMAATALPDPTLAALLEQLAVQEQKQAKLDLLTTEDGPALARIRAVISELSTQIDQRVDVALVELSKKAEAKTADLTRIDDNLKALEEKSRALAPDRWAYFTARRDLESIQFVRERISSRIFQEKVDAGLPTPNQLRTPRSSNESSARKTGNNQSARPDQLLKKLERLRLPRIEFNRVPLPQVIQELTQMARENDPEQRGVNFLLSSATSSETPPRTNAQTGLPEVPSFDEVVVSLNALQDVTLAQALDAVVKCASHPIKFQVAESAVVFSAITPDDLPVLSIRWFKVDPSTFARSLSELIGDGLTNLPPTMGQAPSSPSSNAPAITLARLRRLLTAAGVNLVPPKSMFYNDRLGMLMVRATASDLDVVEQAIQVLNQSPPQVCVEVKFAEVSADDADGRAFLDLLGFDATATNAAPAASIAHPPGSFASGVTNDPSPDRRRHGGVFNTSTNLPPATFTSILKPDQFRAVVRALEKRKGVDLLSMPKVTTLSGRQAQIKTVEIKYVVTDIDNSPAPDHKLRPVAEPFEIGPVLDVIPYVSADGRTIQMTLIPTIKEFLGYDQKGMEVIQAFTRNPTPVPLPMFRSRQVIATANVADGQTVVLSPGAVEVEAKSGDRKGKATRKHLFIFVTPTLIDPAGNRIHSDQNLPFARTNAPPQGTVR